jgi:RNA polymerase sigma-70 factor, ECF subfamily
MGVAICAVAGPAGPAGPTEEGDAMAEDVNLRELLEKAKRHDSEALGTLVELYRSYLTLLARTQIGRRLQGKADAADLVQETFLQVHQHISGFRGTTEGEFLAWLRTILAGIVSNHVRHYLGTQQRDARLEKALAVELDDTSGLLSQGLVADTSTPSRHATKREALMILANAMERLPEDYRQVIMLRHLEGLPFAEVATRMGRTVPSVQNLWVRALARLKQTVGETL